MKLKDEILHSQQLDKVIDELENLSTNRDAGLVSALEKISTSISLVEISNERLKRQLHNRQVHLKPEGKNF